MKFIAIWILLALFECPPYVLRAQLRPLPDAATPCVFTGEARKISILWQNSGDTIISSQIHAKMFQTTPATAVEIGEVPWKKLQVLPQQTVIESAQLNFPAVKTETKFLVQWLDNSNRILGATEVWVYPTNLLAELKPMAEDRSLGVFDPQNQLKPLLKNLGVEFVDLGDYELEHFPGKIAILGPFTTKSQVPDGLAQRIKLLAKKGVAVVWIVPADGDKEFQPSFYLVSEGYGTVVVVQTSIVSDLAENPQSQQNLIYLCQLALHRKFLTLPGLSL